jgi:hypothetical protein
VEFITVISTLFTPTQDNVNFNNLTAIQIAEISNGTDLYNSMAGNDVIFLPSLLNAANLGGSTGVSYNLNHAFTLGSGTDTVYGSDGLSSVAVGTGADTLFLQNGAISVSFTASTGALILDSSSIQDQTGISGTVANFSAGNVIDFQNLPNLTLFAAGQQVVLYSGSSPVADLQFAAGTDTSTLEPVSDGTGGTEIITDTSSPAIVNPSGNKIDWAYIQSNEGKSIALAPYVPANSNGKSGVTIGYGVDIEAGGYNSAVFSSVFSDWRNNPNLSFLEGSYSATQPAGTTNSQAAVAYLQTGATTGTWGPHTNISSLSVSITTAQAAALTSYAENKLFLSISALYNAKSQSNFASLGPNSQAVSGEQTALMDLAYLFGPTGVIKIDGGVFWQDAIQDTNAGWTAAALVLYGLGGPNSARAIIDGSKILSDTGYTAQSAPVAVPESVAANNALSLDFDGLVGVEYAIDPGGASAYELDSVAGSPFISQITLPLEDAVSYSVSYEVGGSWSSSEIAGPGASLSLPSQTQGIQVELLNPDGTLADPTGFTFFIQLASDGEFQGTVTDPSIACFLIGTKIETASGSVAVEEISIGDLLKTGSGDLRSVKWIGRRGYGAPFVASNPHLRPIRFRTGALGGGLPQRDLLVSARHAMYIDGMLLPAEALVNGVSIVRDDPTGDVTYFHIELDTHDIILAEGAPSETFVDDDSRGMFHNAAEYRMLYPSSVTVSARYCAPRVEEGEAVEVIRRRLAAIADDIRVAPLGVLRGSLDEVSRARIRGWACDEGAPNLPMRLRILDNGVALAHVMAASYRGDLEKAGYGNGCHSFDFVVPGGLSPLVDHVIQVHRADDFEELPNSPWTVAAEPDAAHGPPLLTDSALHAAAQDGRVDEMTRDRVRGWALDSVEPGAPVALQILDNGVPIARLLANRYRLDLEQAGMGNGRHGFDIAIPGGLSPMARHILQVRREKDGAELLGSPIVIEAADSFDAALEYAVANAVAALGSGGEQDRVLSFIVAQAEKLLQQSADADGGRAKRLAHQQFRRRWGAQTDDTVEPGLRALVVDERAPDARRDAGSQAVLSHMRALQRLGYAVSFVAADELAPTESTVATLAAAGVSVCAAPFYASVEDVLRRQAGCFDLVYLHRAAAASNYLSLARKYAPRARVLYSVADLHHVRLSRQAAVEQRPELLASSQRMNLTERVAALSADAVLTHSITEVETLSRAVQRANVHQVPWDVPLRPTAIPFAVRSGVAFIGHYGHAPNQDAASWLVETIMPLVWEIDPSITCLLVGSDMTSSILRLARPGVEVVGQVDDLADAVFDRVRVTVAPLRYGAGVKGKVLASVAAGIPCVMSPIASEGLPPSPFLRPLIGEDAVSLAKLIYHHHMDEAANRQAADDGLTLIRENFTEDVVTTALQAAILSQISSRTSSTAGG